MKPAMTAQQRAFADSTSGFKLYKGFAVGDDSWLQFLRYEILTFLFSGMPGVLGFGARALLYRTLFKECGARPAIGRGVVLRQPGKFSIGNKFLLDDYACIDVRGAGQITIGNYVSIGRYTTVCSKNGEIKLGDGVNVGSYCRIATQSKVEIGESVLIAAYSYIGPGNHQAADGETPLIEREMEIKGGVKIGAHAWIGAHTTILDGVTIGERAIIGAHSLVRSDVPDGAIVAGVPAKVIR